MDETVEQKSLCTKGSLTHIFTISVFIQLIQFLNNDLSDELSFPSSLNSKQRVYIREKANDLGLYYKSRFLGPNRYITLYKNRWSNFIKKDIHVSLGRKLHNFVSDFLKEFPVTWREREMSDQVRLSSPPHYDNLIGTPKVPNFKTLPTITDFKKTLPIFKHLAKITGMIQTNQVSLIMGDPGSGKTSQIPQHVMDDCKADNKTCYIVCTQPSRLAAASIAQRVALERNEEVGLTIGYESKLERVRNDKTLITYCSTDVLLRVLMRSKNTLQNITHIFVDDVHERDKLTDTLLIVLKLYMKQYPCLRVILMSSHINTDGLQRYFNGLRIFHVPSECFERHIYFLEDINFLLNSRRKNSFGWKESNVHSDFANDSVIIGDDLNYELILDLIKVIHLTQPPGSILVFLPGFDDVVDLGTALNNCQDLNFSNIKLLYIHNDVQSLDHHQLYSESNGIRKIILTTEFAETSITVYDAEYVLDIGLISCFIFSPVVNPEIKRLPISKARLEHRALRAGRFGSGKYFIFQRKTFVENIPEHSVPQICYAPITDICLMAKCLAPEMSILQYFENAITPPPLSHIQNSVTILTAIEAVDSSDKLTDLGQILLSLSVEPRLGKMIIFSCLFKCLDPVLTIVCCLSFDKLFKTNSNTRSYADIAHCKAKLSAQSFSDHMVYLRAFQMWCKKKTGQNIDANCDFKVINEAAMEYIVNLRIKLVSELRSIELIRPRSPGDMRDLNINSEKWFAIKAALFYGYYPNLANVDENGSIFLHSATESHLSIHPDSSLLNANENLINSLTKLPTRWILYGDICKNNSSSFIKCNTLITSMTVVLLGGPLKIPQSSFYLSIDDSDSEDEYDNDQIVKKASIAIDHWITAYFENSDQAANIFELKQKFASLIAKKLHNLSFVMQPVDDRIIETVINILEEDETNSNIISPPRIGQRPHKSLTVHCRMMCEPIFKRPQTITQTNQENINTMIPNKFPMLLEQSSSCIITEYFLVKAQNSSLIENSRRNGVWVNSSTQKVFLEAASKNSRIILFFCIERDVLTFHGYAEFISLLADEDNYLKINWISNIQAVNNGSIEFLKFLCNKYQKTWVEEFNQLIPQCGQYLERLLSNPIMTTNLGRPIQKSHK